MNPDESSLYLNQLAAEHQMTTANAKMFHLSSSPHQQGINQQDLIAVSSVASTASIPQHHHIQNSPSATSILATNKTANRLSGTEV